MKVPAALLLLLTACAGIFAVEARAEQAPSPAAQAAPLPPERPAEFSGAASAKPTEGKPSEAKSEPATEKSEAPPAPKPPERPAELSVPAKPAETPAEPAPQKVETPPAPQPPERPAELSGQAEKHLALDPNDDTACLRRIERLGVRFEKKEPITNGQCTLANPLMIKSLADDVALEPGDIMNCGVAEALARWATEVQVLAKRDLGDTLKTLKLGGTYVCRGQNHGGEAKLSEHSFANAVDIMSFTFEKHAPIVVKPHPEGTPEAGFQKAARALACRFFRTVLGPGSDAAHANHLHFDERERKGGHRLCE